VEKSLYILIVEDSEDDTLLLMRELKRGGFKPVYQRVETSGAMKSALAERRWDLIVTDYTMPHFNALAALTVLKESGFDIPFIIVSGTIGEERAVAAMKAGAHDYLKKGELARLNPIIQRELREANIRQEQRMAGEMLREQERYFRTLIEYNSDILITLDSSGTILYTSPAFERSVGHTSAETDERAVFAIVHPDGLG
jgi:DNA-binding NtrC family response regulator